MKTNQIYCKSSENMEEIPDKSIHLVITSPPYNVEKEYEKNVDSKDYMTMLHKVWGEVYRVLVPGGRVCINVANTGRKPYIPLHVHIIEDMLSLGFLMRGEIIWDKAASVGSSTAWGSWCSASNPTLRDVHEYIMVFCKEEYGLDDGVKKSTITDKEFLIWTKSIWSFPTASAKKIGHPAPFPEELPHRLIQLYSFDNNIVLDPFSGSGTTALVAAKNNRQYIGYEIDSDYVKLSEERIREYTNQLDLFS